MSLIDVSVLKEWVYNWFTKNRRYHPYAKNNNIPITELYDILEQIPPVEPVRKWIPVSERLPNIEEHHVSEPCIVYCENGAYGFAELQENIFGQVGWNCERDDEYHEALGEVLAWMPLPEPYREEGD